MMRRPPKSKLTDTLLPVSTLFRSLTTVGALAAFQALAIVGAGVASAVTNCTYNPATDSVNITIDSTDTVALMVETAAADEDPRSEEHTSELQSLMSNSYAVFCLKKKKKTTIRHHNNKHCNYN